MSKPPTLEQVLTLLAEGPPRITALAAGLEPAQLRTPPSPEEWSAVEVLAHLRACADVWGKSMRLILTQDRPAIRAVSPRTWIKRTDYPTLEFEPSLQVFAAQRRELLAILEPLPPTAWARAAVVTGAGKPLERTVYDYAQGMAIHERPHLKQIARIVDTLRR